jgi:hypothetical protein
METHLKFNSLGDEGIEVLYAQSTTIVGHLIKGADGYYYFHVENDGGVWSDVMLKELSETIFSLNKEWHTYVTSL